MFRTITIAASLCLSFTSAFAGQTKTVQTVVRQVTVEAANGGINPAYSAYTISGEIDAGSKCNTAGLEVTDVDGVQTVVPFVKKARRCTNPKIQKVSVTVRGRDSFTDNVWIKNVDEVNNDVLLSYLISQTIPSKCDEVVMCTREYRPTICDVNGHPVSGNNLCEAKANARRFACLNGTEFVDSPKACKFKGITQIALPEVK